MTSPDAGSLATASPPGIDYPVKIPYRCRVRRGGFLETPQRSERVSLQAMGLCHVRQFIREGFVGRKRIFVASVLIGPVSLVPVQIRRRRIQDLQRLVCRMRGRQTCNVSEEGRFGKSKSWSGSCAVAPSSALALCRSGRNGPALANRKSRRRFVAQ